ncbi:hypothetical protein HA44_20355 [Mixta gaviniae]|nr:hypothetical protein HA44_20355 [Mixta gaviniae]
MRFYTEGRYNRSNARIFSLMALTPGRHSPFYALSVRTSYNFFSAFFGAFILFMPSCMKHFQFLAEVSTFYPLQAIFGHLDV